jgi:hypothetical protein
VNKYLEPECLRVSLLPMRQFSRQDLWIVIFFK